MEICVSKTWLVVGCLVIAACSNSAEEQQQRIAETQRNSMELAKVNREIDALLARTPQQMRLDQSRAIWREFDGLPDRVQTKDMLVAFALRADQIGANLPPEEKAELDAINTVAFRSRVPRYLVVGESGRAVGPGLTGISPSDDPVRCKELAETWMRNGFTAQLETYGFQRLVCGELSLPIGQP